MPRFKHQIRSRTAPVGTCAVCGATHVKLRRSRKFDTLVCQVCYPKLAKRQQRKPVSYDITTISLSIANKRPADGYLKQEDVAVVQQYFQQLALSIVKRANQRGGT